MIITADQQATLACQDRSIQFGDGHFTTLAVVKGRPAFWPEHLARLQAASNRLFIHSPDWQALAKSVFALAKSLKSGAIKVLISRGQGGRGYGFEDDICPTVLLYPLPMPSHYAELSKRGIHLSISNIAVAMQPLLAGIKHLNRLEQVLIKRQQQYSEYDDLIVCDTDGKIVEATSANVFWRKGNSWFTPDLSYSGVDGVMRNLVLQYFDEKMLSVEQIRADSEVLTNADEIVLTNCLMPVLPVISFTDANNQIFNHYQSNTSRELLEWINKKISSEHES